MILPSFTQKALLPVWALLLLLALLDSCARLSSKKINPDDHWQAEQVQHNSVQKLRKIQAEQITESINEYEYVEAPEVEEVVKIAPTMSEAEQAAQQGDLNQLYAGDIRFRLMGIFASNGHFAVLLRKELSSDTQKMLKVQIGERLKNYQISKILANKVLLEADDGRQISLNLFTDK